MARTMRYDSADIYRVVVDVHIAGDRYEGGFYQGRVVYGPHDTSVMAKDYSDRWDRDYPRRLLKQSLRPDENCQLYWDTIKTEYRNGGEDVSWSDEL
jgi:hypothetical protein